MVKSVRKRIKDWLLVLALLLDEIAAAVIILLVLWFFKIEISLPIIIVMVLMLGGFVFLTHKAIIPSLHRKRVAGKEGMIGSMGEVIEPLTPLGIVRFEGEYWKAESADGDIGRGEYVEILGTNKLVLAVKRGSFNDNSTGITANTGKSAEGFLDPGYIALYWSGELKKRVEALEVRLASCDICPRECGVNRLKDERGECHSGRLPAVASFCAHNGEEPALSGKRGSGTIFFGNCNLRCVYCQNYQISQDYDAQRLNEVDTHTLAGHMLYLQDKQHCHNINLVSPSHFVPQIMRAVLEAVPMGLRLPLVYNTSSYDSLKTLKELDGIVSIYLADLRYAEDEKGKEYSDVPDYVRRAHSAIKEMYRQVGDLVLDDEDIARQGLIIRHLILPNRLAGSRESLTWLAGEVSPNVTLSIMSQYHPAHRAYQFPLLARTITEEEYLEITGILDELGMENGWLQGMDASRHYLPDFKARGHPFESDK